MLDFILRKAVILRISIYTFVLTAILYLLSAGSFSGQLNDFIINDPLIPLASIHHGGPPKDGIPSIDKPDFITSQAATYLHHDARILGLNINNKPKAYPINILNWHEIVNDENVLVSYCPLCGTGIAFKAIDADFGVSGLLYNNDMLLYDRETESLWSQILGKAISGKRKGQKLEMLVVENTSWGDWLNKHPDTQVLSNDTGFNRDYSRSPYGNYSNSKSLYFPITSRDNRYHPKEKIIGIRINNQYKAYPFIELDKTGKNMIQDELAGQNIEIFFDSKHRSGIIKTDSGKTLPSITSYWFAWYTFHPETEVYTRPVR